MNRNIHDVTIPATDDIARFVSKKNKHPSLSCLLLCPLSTCKYNNPISNPRNTDCPKAARSLPKN